MPSARIERGPRRWSLAWIVPVLALVLVGVLGWQALARRGSVVEISFPHAQGLRVDDPVAYRGVQVGRVRAVRLDPGSPGVVVEAELRPDAGFLAVEGSRFWIVRPELSLRRVAGLETLLGPRYIEVRPGEGQRRREFVGLGRAPDAEAAGGLLLTLKAERRGSLAEGSPVYFRDIQVGHVLGFELARDATAVDVFVAIQDRYAPLVRDTSRFWSIGGLGVDWGLFRGLTVQADSLQALLGGGIGFATPPDTSRRTGVGVRDGHVFELAPEPDSAWLRWAPEIDLTDGGL